MTADARVRVLLYAHDGRGLGHAARMLALAAALLEHWPGTEVVLATGAVSAQALAPAGCEVVKLPSYLTVESDGHFDTRAANLSLPLADLVRLRSEILTGLVRYVRPAVLMSDFSPVGKASELLGALRLHRRLVPAGLRVLTLRAVVDAPAVAARDNLSPAMRDFIAEWYRAVLIFGHPDLCDFTDEYGLAASAGTELVYLNLLAPPRTLAAVAAARPLTQDPAALRHLLLAFGSGYRAGPIAALLLEVLPDLLGPADRVTILCGPRLPAATLGPLPGGLAGEVVQFTSEVDDYYRRATHVVALGGVNTTTEVIAWRRPALILTLDQGEAEQEILLARLARMTSLLTLAERDLSPTTLARALARLLERRTLELDPRLDCGGAARAVAAVARLWREAADPARVAPSAMPDPDPNET